MEMAMILGAIVVLICICSNRLSDKIGVPALVIFIAVGMLFGTDGIVHIDLTIISWRSTYVRQR